MPTQNAEITILLPERVEVDPNGSTTMISAKISYEDREILWKAGYLEVDESIKRFILHAACR